MARVGVQIGKVTSRVLHAYDPSRESMLAFASPSYEIAIVTTGLVNNCLGQFRTPIHHYSTLAIYNI